MNTLIFLMWLASGALLLNVLGFLTARADAYLQKRDRHALAPQPAPRVTEVVPQGVASVPAISAEYTAGYWWAQLCTPTGLFGLFVGVLQVPIVVINSHLLAATLETILDRPGMPLIPVTLFGWEREITEFDLIGGLISLGQMVAASAVHLVWPKRQRFWLVFGAALTALLCLMSYEAGASFYRGMQVEGTLWNALLSCALALGVATVEGVVGIFFLDHLLLSLLLAGLWSLATPIRALTRWWSRRQAQGRVRAVPRQDNRPHTLLLIGVYPLVALEHAVLSPLRRLDRAVGALMPGRTPAKEGEYDHAEPCVVKNAESLRVSRNGSDPRGVQGDRRQHVQTDGYLDDRA